MVCTTLQEGLMGTSLVVNFVKSFTDHAYAANGANEEQSGEHDESLELEEGGTDTAEDTITEGEGTSSPHRRRREPPAR